MIALIALIYVLIASLLFFLATDWYLTSLKMIVCPDEIKPIHLLQWILFFPINIAMLILIVIFAFLNCLYVLLNRDIKIKQEDEK